MNDFFTLELESKFAELPLNLNANHIAAFLGVCQATAYTLTHSPGFPRLKIPGSRLIIIPKVLFYQWYINNCVTADSIN
jgi:hypothetical protein